MPCIEVYFLMGLYHSFEAHDVLDYGLVIDLNSLTSVLVTCDLLISTSSPFFHLASPITAVKKIG